MGILLIGTHEGVDKNDDRILNNDKNLKRPMISYGITDDEINRKKESNIDTAGTTNGRRLIKSLAKAIKAILAPPNEEEQRVATDDVIESLLS